MNPSGRRAIAVRFEDLRVWSADSVFQVDWGWDSEVIQPLSTVLERQEIVVKQQGESTDSFPLVRLGFDGTMKLRDPDGVSGIKGRLFGAKPGEVVYSKIDVRNGAIGVVPPELGQVAVTSEFPVYRVEPSKALPEYIQLVFRTAPFRRAINSMKSGHSGRKRVQPLELEAIEVPLPAFPVQQAIVDLRQRADDRLRRAQDGLRRVVNDLDRELWSHYFETTKDDVLLHRALGLVSAALRQWDVKSARAAAFRAANPSLIPLREFAEESTELVDPRECPDEDWPVYGVNNREGVFFSHFQKGREFGSNYKRIRKDWFFHNPTRSAVGSLGIVPDVPDNAITSPEYQVWRIKLGLAPDFVAVLINTSFFVQMVQFHRVGAVKQRLYVDNLLSIPIPNFSAERQATIADARRSALVELREAKRNVTEAARTVEALIIGRESLGDHGLEPKAD